MQSRREKSLVGGEDVFQHLTQIKTAYELWLLEHCFATGEGSRLHVIPAFAWTLTEEEHCWLNLVVVAPRLVKSTAGQNPTWFVCFTATRRQHFFPLSTSQTPSCIPAMSALDLVGNSGISPEERCFLLALWRQPASVSRFDNAHEPSVCSGTTSQRL